MAHWWLEITMTRWYRSFRVMNLSLLKEMRVSIDLCCLCLNVGVRNFVAKLVWDVSWDVFLGFGWLLMGNIYKSKHSWFQTNVICSNLKWNVRIFAPQELDELDGAENDRFLHSLESAVFTGTSRYYTSPAQVSARPLPSNLNLGDMGDSENGCGGLNTALVTFIPTSDSSAVSDARPTSLSTAAGMQQAGDLANAWAGYLPFLPPGSPVIGFAFYSRRDSADTSTEDVLKPDSDLQMRQLRVSG